MPGAAVRAIKRTTFTFTGVAAAIGPETTIAQGINISQFRELVSMLRFHAWTFTGAGTGAKIEVRLRASAPTEEDPAQSFRPTSAVAQLYTITKGDAAPQLQLSGVLTGLGTHVDVTIQFTQGTAADTHNISISMDFALKS